MAFDDESVVPADLPAIVETAGWEEHLPALITGVKVRGGDQGEGASNFQARVLDKRTRWLKETLEALAGGGGKGINLIGELASQEDLDAISTVGLEAGTAYFVQFHLRVWNGATWGDSGSLRGAQGLNLLGSWPDGLDLPERTENEVGDAYIWRSDFWVLSPEPGSWEALNIQGPDGKSTYQLWLEQPGNTGKTVEEFLAVQKGLPGDNSFELWKKIPGNESKTEEDFWVDQKGPDGKSTFETWLELPGNAGKTEAEFIVDQKGAPGEKGDARAPFVVAGVKATVGELPTPGDETQAWYVDVDLHVWVEADSGYVMIPGVRGKSAFQIWQDNGHPTGTLEEFLDDMKGYDGSSIDLKGNLTTQEELDAIPTVGLKVGTAYFLDYALRVWDGTLWASSGSLRGARGINLLGVWPNAVPLPDPAENEVGDAYIWQNDFWVLLPSGGGWEALGIRGPDGKDTYQLWKEQPGNEAKTITQFLAEQKGEKGDDAYEAWLKIPENDGKSRTQWVEETRGLPGETGPARAPFHIAGTKPNMGALPSIGTEEEAWYVGIDLYVWVAADAGYVMIPGISGKSAFERWLELSGNEGKTEEDFWLAMKGAKGEDSVVPGPKGADGRNLRILGTVPTSADLSQLQDPLDQDAYATLDTGRLWMFLPTEGGWKDLGPWRGVDGKSAYQLWVEDGHEGETIGAFWTFLKGKDGVSFEIRGAVNTFADLPGSPEEQWIYSVRDVNSFYAYIGGAWMLLGTFGQDGKDGTSLDIIKILTEEDQTLPELTEATLGKAYVDLDKFVWVNVQNTWQNAGKFKGDQGEIGPMGKSMVPRGTVGSVNQLPSLATVEEGDLWYTADTKLGYCKVDGQWSDPIDNIGPVGPPGEQGTPGALMPIKGVYPSMAALRSAHATGALGDAYMIIDAAALPDPIRNLAIWSVEQNDWVDTGPAGIKGEKGEKGNDSIVPGPKGDKGSQWLTLNTFDAPSNTFNGRAGDWAVNKTMKVFYKTVNEGWVFWGELVAGDVNSPLLSLGKVVRLGNEWVPLPVDEVPGMVAGKPYVRKLVEGSVDNEGEWAELIFPPTLEEPTADGKHYVRARLVGEEVGGWIELPYVLPEAPNDGKVYGRKKNGETLGEWIEIPTGIADLTLKDGKTYARSFATDGVTPIWKEFTTIPDLTVKDGKSYVRVFETNGSEPYWKEVIIPSGGISEAPAVNGKTYLRNGYTASWVEYIQGILAPAGGNDGKQYVFKNSNWISLDRYDLLIKSISATYTIDPLAEQFVKLDNSGATAKTISIADGPVGRGMLVVLDVVGVAGAISYGGTNIKWDGNVIPSLTGTKNLITFTWDGTVWIGGKGPGLTN